MGNKIQKIYVGDHYQVYPKWKVNSNTVAYYPLTSDANDYSGNNRNGTASGVTYTTQSGVVCAYFSGSSSSYVSLPGFGTLSSLTVSMWAWSTNDGSKSVIYNTAPSSNNANLSIYFGNSIDASRWNGSNSDYQSTGIKGNNGVWHNVIVTNGGSGMKIYVDGTLGVSSSNVRTVKSDNSYNYIGKRPTSGGLYLGCVSNMIFENVVWSADDVADYYNQTKANYGL